MVFLDYPYFARRFTLCQIEQNKPAHNSRDAPISHGLTWTARNSVMALILSFIFLWTFMPILWTFSQSLKGIKELYSMPVRFIPHDPSLDNYS